MGAIIDNQNSLLASWGGPNSCNGRFFFLIDLPFQDAAGEIRLQLDLQAHSHCPDGVKCDRVPGVFSRRKGCLCFDGQPLTAFQIEELPRLRHAELPICLIV